MKTIIKFKRLLCIALLFVSANAYAQVIYDDFAPATTKSSVLGPKWNKTSLTYYIDHTYATGLSNTVRESIIQAAFQKWANVSSFTFTKSTSSSGVDILISFAYRDGNSANTTTENVLAWVTIPRQTTQLLSFHLCH